MIQSLIWSFFLLKLLTSEAGDYLSLVTSASVAVAALFRKCTCVWQAVCVRSQHKRFGRAGWAVWRPDWRRCRAPRVDSAQAPWIVSVS